MGQNPHPEQRLVVMTRWQQRHGRAWTVGGERGDDRALLLLLLLLSESSGSVPERIVLVGKGLKRERERHTRALFLYTHTLFSHKPQGETRSSRRRDAAAVAAGTRGGGCRQVRKR